MKPMNRPTKDSPLNERLRTAAALAASGGVALAGVGVYRAATKAGQAVEKAGNTVESIGHTAGTVNKAGSAIRRHLTTFPTFKKVASKLHLSGRLRPIEFGFLRRFTPSVAQDRYKKTIHEHEEDRAIGNYVKSAAAGAVLGGALRGRRGLKAGALAGLGTQAAVRTATSGTKDTFGDRAPAAKKIEKIPAAAAATAALIIAAKKAKGRKLMRHSARVRRIELDLVGEGLTAAQKIAAVLKKKASAIPGMAEKLGGKFAAAPLAVKSAAVGGLAFAPLGAAASAIAPDKNTGRVDSAAHGAIKDGLFGAGLYGIAEPLAKKLLRTPHLLSRKVNGRSVIEFKSREEHHSHAEARDAGSRFQDSLKGYIEKSANYRGRPVEATDTPVLRNTLRRAAVVNRVATRGSRLVRDGALAVQGKRRTDARGRPLKYEHEKAYVGNAIKTGVIAGAGLAAAAHLRNNPAHYKEIQAVKRGITGERVARRGPKGTTRYVLPPAPKSRVGKSVVRGATKARGAIKNVARKLFAAERAGVIELDYYGKADWDLRDPRGKSARVFAPGSKTRERRPKKWHEKADTQRKLGGALAVAGTLAGLVVGGKVGARRAERRGAEALAAAKKRRPAWNKGLKRELTPDGPVFHNRKKGRPPA